MEYCVQIRVPWYKKDKELPQKVKQRVTGMIRGLEHVSYEETAGAGPAYPGKEKTERGSH